MSKPDQNPAAQTIRCFLAIALSSEVKERIRLYLNQLDNVTEKIRWVRPANLHLTLKFLGEVPAQKVDQIIIRLIDHPPQVSPFRINITGFGAFPNRRKPRVLWLGIESIPHEPLYKLQKHIENELEPIGFKKEKRRFSPHLTLARIKYEQNFDALWAFVDEQAFSQITFDVEEYLLIRSLLTPDGAQYRTIQKYPLR